jgi:glycosyltransferase involved in cell wall biosynthesis
VRVLHIQKVGGIGGSERGLLQLLPPLTDVGVDVRMVVLGDDAATPFVEPLSVAGVDTVVLPAGPDLNPRLITRLRREVRSYRPDLVHTHLLHADFHGQVAAKLAGARGVSTVHSTAWMYRRQPHLTIARLAGRLPVRTIAIADHVARFIIDQRVTPAERVRVVHYGIDPAQWTPTRPRDGSARHEMGVGADDFVVGVISRLVAHKGHDFLFRAAGQLARDLPQLRVLVAGVGELDGSLRRLANELCPDKTIRFLGYVDNVRLLVGASDVIVLPSLPGFGEGFPMVTLEAMALGRPVVTSALYLEPEIIVDDETGFTVPPGDDSALAALLKRLADDGALRERLGRAARERAVREFSVQRMVEGTIAVYEEALASGDPSRS